MKSPLNFILNDYRYNRLSDTLDDIDYFFERHLTPLSKPVHKLYQNVSTLLWNNRYAAYITKQCSDLISDVLHSDVPSFSDNKRVMSVFEEVLVYSGLCTRMNVKPMLRSIIAFASSYDFGSLPGVSQCTFQDMETKDWHVEFNDSMHRLSHSTSYSSIFEAVYCYIKWVESSGYLNDVDKSLFFTSM